MTSLAVIRPEPGNMATRRAAQELGLKVLAVPLFEVVALDWQVPDPAQFDALLIGSANALRHAGPGLDALKALPVLCVGEASAEAARAAGLRVIATGQGGLQALLDSLADAPRRLLRLAGRERVELRLPEGTSMAERVVYASEPRPLDPARLPDRAVVALHSAEAARHFAAECDRLALPRGRFALVALAPRVAAAAGPGWAALAVAESADDAALLAQARALCQGTGTISPGPN